MVKVRPEEPEVDDQRDDIDGFKFEADAVGDKAVRSASFKTKLALTSLAKQLKQD